MEVIGDCYGKYAFSNSMNTRMNCIISTLSFPYYFLQYDYVTNVMYAVLFLQNHTKYDRESYIILRASNSHSTLFFKILPYNFPNKYLHVFSVICA